MTQSLKVLTPVFACTSRAMLALACSALLGACCVRPNTPTITASGQNGAYVHAGGPADLRAGLAQPPAASGWPPAAASAPDGKCVDEAKQLEQSLGAAPIACPAVQAAPVPAVVDGDADAPIAAAGFQLLCYELGSAMLVVEYQQTGSLCSHVIGLAVYHRR